MSRFPTHPYDDIGAYASDYWGALAKAIATVPLDSLRQAAQMLEEVVTQSGTIFVFGNGGSAAIADHLVCDCMKGARTGTHFAPRLHSLVGNTALLTAIANDLSYDDIFAYQLQAMAKPGDMALAISSSGASPNVVKALRWASTHGLSTLALTGFSGGDAARIVDAGLYVEADNYGLVEDAHQSIMHILAQYLRQRHLVDRSDLMSLRF